MARIDIFIIQHSKKCNFNKFL